MGGRGASTKIKNNDSDRWQWLTDVETDRLKRYIARSDNLKQSGIDNDPQGRHIHDVAYFARLELKDREG